MKSQLNVIILAAGLGTRMKSKRAKVLHRAGGLSLIEHVVRASSAIAPADRTTIVVGHQGEQVRALLAPSGVRFVDQKEQKGTGHALLACRKSLASESGLVVVLYGDCPLLAPSTLSELVRRQTAGKAAATLITTRLDDPTGYGRIIFGDHGKVQAIVEQKDLTPEQLHVREINSGIYCFETRALFANLDALDTNNAHGEFYLTDVAAMLVAEGKRVVAVKADSVDEVLGANTIAEMMHLDAAMRLATAKRLMAAGVTIFRPETCIIDSEVTIGPDTVIEPYVQLLGRTTIGSESRIRSYSVIQNSQLGDNVTVRNGCILDTAEVADNAILGPYAHLRPESRIGDGAHVGNFVETKKTTMGKGSKANHLSYLGDTVIGAGVNIGAGAITCNYDGVHKHLTTIGDGAFIGSDSTLVAPVTIGAGSYVAAGSSITEDVPEGALALGRSRQTTKPGWVAARKAAADAKKGC